jgi:hypothetical protein
MAWTVALLLACFLPIFMLMTLPVGASGPDPLQVDQFLCDGDPLLAQTYAGPVDAPDIPNTLSGTVPGAFVVLNWRGVRLQLPRTNNADVPSYTDGRWWWSQVEADQPQFRQRRGAIESYQCERASTQLAGLLVNGGLASGRAVPAPSQSPGRAAAHLPHSAWPG